MVPLTNYILLSAVIFIIGAAGCFFKRNIIQILLSIELMLNAANLAFVAFSSFAGESTGQLFVFIVMTVAAAEAAVGLALVIAIYRHQKNIRLQEATRLKG